MFDNIGEKIKVLAKVLFWIGVLGSFVLAFYYLYMFSGYGGAAIIIFAVTAFAGGLISWISTIFLYGFGQLVENSDKLVKLNQTKKADQNLEI